MFIVGLEIDIGYVRKNWKIASTVGLVSLIIPFGLGVAMSVGLYETYVPQEDRENITFGVYALFIGVASAITAFPVLARILTELGLLRDRVGVVVLAAGISNDIVGWILLALTITLANSAKAINTLYIILLTIAWFLLLVIVIKPALTWYLKKTGSIENGPSEMAVSVCILLAFVSAFYTDIIGVHPIFGSFLAGAIIPRDNHFVVKLTEKIEDFITLILLPLYFSLAGLNVNIGALNDGVTWGYVICAITVSMFGKIVGGTIPAKLHGLRWRESFTVGGLMSCKGIVEIVVLQLGFQAGILSVQVFSMFVIMALITTFITTPLTLRLYPLWYRTKLAKWRNGEIEWDGTPIVTRRDSTTDDEIKEFKLNKIAVIMDTVESMPVIMMLTQLLAAPQSFHTSPYTISPRTPTPGPDVSREGDEGHEGHELAPVLSENTLHGAFITEKAGSQGLYVTGLRLVELSERTADLIQVMSGELIDGSNDPVLQVFSTFTKINHIPFEGKVAITPHLDRANIIMSIAQQPQDLLVMAWENSNELIGHPELLDNIPELREGTLPTTLKLSVCRDVFTSSKSQVSLFLDRGFSTATADNCDRRVIVPYFGGQDDIVAIGLAFYLAKNADITVTICNLSGSDEAWSHVKTLYDSIENYRVKHNIRLVDYNKTVKDIVVVINELFNGLSTVNDLVIIGLTDNSAQTEELIKEPVVEVSLGSVLQTDKTPTSADSAGSVVESSSPKLVGEVARQLICSSALECSFFLASGPRISSSEDYNEK